jgi:hypothetical protein
MKKNFAVLRQLKLEDVPELEGGVDKSTDTKTEPKTTDSVEASAEDALKKVVEKEREAAKNAKKEAAKLREELKAIQDKFANVDPAQYAALVKEREDLAAKQSEQERSQAEMGAKFETERLKLTESYNSKLAAMQAQTEALQQQLLSVQRSQLLEKEFIGVNGRTEISDGISYFKVLDNFVGNKFKLSEDGASLNVVRDDGTPMMSIEDPKQPMSPKEYLKSLHQHDVLGSCFKLESVPSGSGNNRTTTGFSVATTTVKKSRAQQLLEAREG